MVQRWKDLDVKQRRWVEVYTGGSKTVEESKKNRQQEEKNL